MSRKTTLSRDQIRSLKTQYVEESYHHSITLSLSVVRSDAHNYLHKGLISYLFSVFLDKVDNLSRYYLYLRSIVANCPISMYVCVCQPRCRVPFIFLLSDQSYLLICLIRLNCTCTLFIMECSCLAMLGTTLIVLFTT